MAIRIRFRRKKLPRIAVLRIDGIIEEGDEDSLPRRVSAALEDVEHVKAKALIMRVNSPGGTVGATQEVYDALCKFRAKSKMPVVASMGDVAASGGIYVAMAAERVLANAGTVTGSIGVIIRSRNLSQLFSKVGVQAEVVKSGEFKDTPAYYRSLTEAERGMLQEMINDSYEQFVEIIMRGRNLSPEKVRQFADGRVMTGRQALAWGLVDELGGFDRAVEVAKQMAHITVEPELVEVGRVKPKLWERLTRRFINGFGMHEISPRLDGIPLYLMPRF
ncbi:MAG: signal peptide peptidase SppA [candidate division KSB1 bacterium]|nr:signal peptide peptidase SppA [candidate division KSB1 bacterium]MDZ7302125.1 signal peptide peptidase SppA [candidate division KSB1 bacterium]MDZ7311235.1 signal peptide peptidase SppA [candidate division KSB1 bacterium]